MGASPLAASDLDRALWLLALDPDDEAATREAYEQVCVEPTYAAWVRETASMIREAIGLPSPPPALRPRPGGEWGVVGYLPVLALAAVLPDTLAFHASRGVSAEVTRATLLDVGRMLRRNRVWEARPGLGDELAYWLLRHATGAIYELGRLQYERVHLGMWIGSQMAAAGLPVGAGDLAISLHIPQSGPLTPAVVDESFGAARRFFRRRFPEEALRWVVCLSWLLDPQLCDYLSADSNLVRFQQRFTLAPGRDTDGDVSVRKFVFGDTGSPLGRLPQRTTLERAVVTHLGAGRHWWMGTGWVDLRRA